MDIIQPCEIALNVLDGRCVSDNIKSPSSLFRLCLNFIGANIVYVDSFIGLPSDIAEKIFQIALHNKVLSLSTKQVGVILSRLCEAYTVDFLSSLKCNDGYFMAVYEDMFPYIMTYVKEMDISNCMIGNNSALLRKFCNMPNLTILNISNNALTEQGFRNIFMPYRVLKKGFTNLLMIDVSMNEISKSTIRCISKLPMIIKICFTAPSEILVDNNIFSKIFSESSFYICEKNDRNEFTSIGIQGWGARLIASWHLCLREKLLKNESKLFCNTENVDVLQCNKFYGAKRKILQHQIGNKLFGSAPNEACSQLKMVYIKYIKQNSDNENVKLITTNCCKRTFTNSFMTSTNDHNSSNKDSKLFKLAKQCEKKRKLNDYCEDDMLETELLSIYKSY